MHHFVQNGLEGMKRLGLFDPGWVIKRLVNARYQTEYGRLPT